MMIAVSASEKGLEAPAVSIFGRAPYFVIVDVKGADVKLAEDIQNPGAREDRGAGIVAAQTIINKGVMQWYQRIYVQTRTPFCCRQG